MQVACIQFSIIAKCIQRVLRVKWKHLTPLMKKNTNSFLLSDYSLINQKVLFQGRKEVLYHPLHLIVGNLTYFHKVNGLSHKKWHNGKMVDWTETCLMGRNRCHFVNWVSIASSEDLLSISRGLLWRDQQELSLLSER